MRFKSVLSDVDLVDIFALGIGDLSAKHFDKLVDVLEQSILAKLAEQDPVAWRHSLKMECDQQIVKLTESVNETPHGKPGLDYSPEYHVEITPLYAHPIPAQNSESTLEQEVLEMVRMLEAREWADHVGQSDLGKRLEWVISTLHNELSRSKAFVSPAIDKPTCVSESAKSDTQHHLSYLKRYQKWRRGEDKTMDEAGLTPKQIGEALDWLIGVAENHIEEVLELARNQPCGCVICRCEKQDQCQGCGAKSCGTHEVGEIPNPVYVDHIADVRKMVGSDHIPDAEKMIEPDADKVDAGRYRWLRDPKNDVALVLDKRTGYVPEDEQIPGVGGYHTYEYRAGVELDAAIDAARGQCQGCGAEDKSSALAESRAKKMVVPDGCQPPPQA